MCYPHIWFSGSCMSEFHFHVFALLSAMASADVRKELLVCSVCLNMYTDPVTLRCGHNFCRVCIDRVLDTQKKYGVYSCPECRAESVERPVLVKNITLCNIVETFLFTQSAQEEIGIFCTYCVDLSVPAVKSCLHCEASLCDKHLRVHSKAPEHVLIEPTTSLEKKKCSIHKKILEYFCIEDSTCVCVSCSLAGEHRGHQVEMLDEASEKKKKRLRNVLQVLITKKNETDKRVQSLQERKSKVHRKVDEEAEEVSTLFRDVMRQLKDLEKRVLGEISRKKEELSLPISNLIQQLALKKDELSMKIQHIEELCNMTDPLTVLQGPDMGIAEERDDKDQERQEKHLFDGGHLEVGLILQTLHKLSRMVRDVKIDIYIPKTADMFLDVSTAHNNLHISDDRKTASWSEIMQKRPETPERFQCFYIVLGSSSFSSGRYYWDVECSKAAWWRIGMCFPSIERKGVQSHLGANNKSWCLLRKKGLYAVMHDSKVFQLPPKSSTNRFRISLDYEGGQLSFYELCEPIRRLYTFTATFTEPLHAAICVYCRTKDGGYLDSLVRIVDPQR